MSTSASTLPPEIWLKIIHWVRFITNATFGADSTTIKNLSVVSASFRSVVQPDLFVSLTINMAMDDYGTIETRLDGLLDLLKNRPESTCWVRMFTCDGQDKHTDRPALWHRVSSLFIQLQSLTLISFSNFPITFSMISHIHGLPNLHSLHVDTNVSLALEIQALEDAQVRLPLLIVPPNIDPREKAAPLSAPASLVTTPAVRSLSLHGPGSLQTILDAIDAHPTVTFSHISSLSLLADPTILSFFDYSHLFPNLTDLTLIPYAPATSLPASCAFGLPDLQEFCGNTFAAALVVPGRPIKTLDIFSERDSVVLSKQILSSISSGSVQLLRLTFYSATWRDGCLIDITELLPGLTFLALEHIKGDWMAWLEGRLSAELRELPVLRTLHLSASSFPKPQKVLPEERQKVLMNELKSSAPSLREVKITGMTWFRDDSSDWTQTNQRVFW